jgi:hypothetical protein
MYMGRPGDRAVPKVHEGGRMITSQHETEGEPSPVEQDLLFLEFNLHNLNIYIEDAIVEAFKVRCLLRGLK